MPLFLTELKDRSMGHFCGPEIVAPSFEAAVQQMADSPYAVVGEIVGYQIGGHEEYVAVCQGCGARIGASEVMHFGDKDVCGECAFKSYEETGMHPQQAESAMSEALKEIGSLRADLVTLGVQNDNLQTRFESFLKYNGYAPYGFCGDIPRVSLVARLRWLLTGKMFS